MSNLDPKPQFEAGQITVADSNPEKWGLIVPHSVALVLQIHEWHLIARQHALRFSLRCRVSTSFGMYSGKA